MLTCHSKIIIPPECGFIVWLQQTYSNWRQLDSANESRVDNFLDDLFGAKKFDTWGISRSVLKKHIVDTEPDNYASLCMQVYAAYGNSIKKSFTIWGDKNNFYLNYLNEILSLYKNARFLHIVRDGRDVACSYREVMEKSFSSRYAPQLPVDISEIAMEWATNVTNTNNFLSKLPNQSAMTIRYEELVKSPASTIKHVCAWLGVPYEENVNNFYSINKNKALEPSATIDWKKRTLQPISDETVGIFMRKLTSREKEKFCKTAASALSLFSYN
jgi:hypothetical protein